MKLDSLLALLDQKGKDYALNTRNRLRTAYIAAKTYGKNPNWMANDDNAFDAIDLQTSALVHDAGFTAALPAQAASLATASIDEIGAEVARRGYQLLPAQQQPARPKAPFGGLTPDELREKQEETAKGNTAPQQASPVLKPPSFA